MIHLPPAPRLPWARGKRERGLVTATCFMTLLYGT